ncbi:MAG: hypothetical protein HPZ85_02360 [Sutterella sp.]|jgi:hypothetical protein|nr:hypothetical protein [Sutterella sp.]DAU46750.1 MAG TPA: hypothetical protein [Caudoviricetes sp.]
MRFRLKDRELQKKLDEISNGGLSRMLGRLPYYTTQSSEPDFLHFSKNPHLMLEVTSDMLESLREYNPHGWNSFPEVEPPEGVLMRVECNQMKTCLVFENGKWRYPSGESFENYEFAFPVKRFRPWDEDDEA